MNKIKRFFMKIFRIHKPSLPQHPYYTERDTRCDKCELLSKCLEDDGLLDITKMSDSRKHYICGMGFECRLRED